MLALTPTPYHPARQHSVTAPRRATSPVLLPPRGSQEPGTYTGAVMPLLPSAIPAGRSVQKGASCAVTGRDTAGPSHAAPVEMERLDRHWLPEGGSQLHAEQDRPSA